MSEFHVGDRVRIDIPDETDHNHDRYHGEYGQIVDILADEAARSPVTTGIQPSTEYSSAPVGSWIFIINRSDRRYSSPAPQIFPNLVCPV
jgi:hypothetical protein